MQKSLQLFSTSLLGLTLSLAVCLMGVHAKELTSISHSPIAKEHATAKKEHGTVKLQHDPHNHVDHQTSKSIVKVFGDQTSMQADAKSLRKVRHGSKRKVIRKLQFSLRLLPLGA